MKDRSKATKRLTLNSRDIHAGWIVGAGASVVVCLLATFAVAYRHDVYSSSLGLRDLVSTDVWFRVFLALTCFSLLLFLGLLVYAFIAGRMNRSGDNEGQEALPTVDEKAPAIEQPERIIIDTARLRDLKLLEEFILREGRYPFHNEDDEEEYRLYRFIGNRRSACSRDVIPLEEIEEWRAFEEKYKEYNIPRPFKRRTKQ